jgi:hypothetical protein
MSTKDDELRPEYPAELIKSGIRGKFARRYRGGTNVVLLDPDVAREFRDAAAVNEALRNLILSRKKAARKTT